eukprot:gene5053-5415_t
MPSLDTTTTTTQPQASSKKQTKRLQKSTDNPFQSNHKSEITKRVNVGIAGQTPKKIIPNQKPSYNGKGLDAVTEHSTEEEESPLPANETHHNILSAQEFLARQSSRPKTGRGKHNPSPDEFFDYVVPSPSHDRLAANRLVINHRSKKAILLADEEKVAEENENDSNALAVETERHDISNNYLLGLNLDGIQRGKQVALLGCWLFGSALKI